MPEFIRDSTLFPNKFGLPDPNCRKTEWPWMKPEPFNCRFFSPFSRWHREHKLLQQEVLQQKNQNYWKIECLWDKT